MLLPPGIRNDALQAVFYNALSPVFRVLADVGASHILRLSIVTPHSIKFISDKP